MLNIWTIIAWAWFNLCLGLLSILWTWPRSPAASPSHLMLPRGSSLGSCFLTVGLRVCEMCLFMWDESRFWYYSFNTLSLSIWKPSNFSLLLRLLLRLISWDYSPFLGEYSSAEVCRRQLLRLLVVWELGFLFCGGFSDLIRCEGAVWWRYWRCEGRLQSIHRCSLGFGSSWIDLGYVAGSEPYSVIYSVSLCVSFLFSDPKGSCAKLLTCFLSVQDTH